MKLIELTAMTVDRNYPCMLNADDISVMVRMPKYTYVELNNGSKYKIYETVKEIMKRMDAPAQSAEPKKEKKSTKKAPTA